MKPRDTTKISGWKIPQLGMKISIQKKWYADVGQRFDSVEGTYGWEQHSIDGCNYGYSVLPVKTGTIHHEATGHNEQKWVQDSAEWTETVTTGYKVQWLMDATKEKAEKKIEK